MSLYFCTKCGSVIEVVFDSLKFGELGEEKLYFKVKPCNHCMTNEDSLKEDLQAKLDKSEAWANEWYDRFWEVSHILKMPGSPGVNDVFDELRKVTGQEKVEVARVSDDAPLVVMMCQCGQTLDEDGICPDCGMGGITP